MKASRIAWPAAALLLPLSLLVAGHVSAQEVSKIRIGTLTSNTSTTTANSYYPATTTSTREFWGPDPNANRPVELKELARALRNDADLIYEYVHDNIRTEFMYGLKKGALGAVIDQSGTSFDQAHLMVELLREAGYSARYKAGTLQLNATQMNAWLGSNDSTSVQQILRDGGFPLNYSGTGPTYTIGHIWVEVTIPGAACNTTCWFDPSYKSHTFKPTLSNLETLMGWSGTEFDTGNPSGFLGQAWSTLQQQATPAVPVWVSNVNHNATGTSGIEYKLKTYSTNLATQLQSPTYSASETEDIIGGQDIVKSGDTPVRNNNALPGFTTAVQRTWDCPSSTQCGIPDAYRTKFIVKMLDQANPGTAPPLINKTLFVDEVYGRRLQFNLPLALSLPDQGDGTESLEPWCVKLELDTTPVAGGTVGCSGQTTPAPNQRVHLVRLEVDSPYAAGTPAGSYMDMTSALGNQVDKRVDFGLPVSIVHGWGDVSSALVSKLSSEQRMDKMLPLEDIYNPEAYEPSDTRGNTAMDHTQMKLGLAYLAQYSRMAEVQKRLGGTEHQQHFAVGVVYGVARIQQTWPPANQAATTKDWSVMDRGIRINMDAAISINSKANVPADRRKVIHSTMTAAAIIESSIFEQNLDQLFVGSTGTRFQWGNANGASKFYLFTTMPTLTDYQNLYSSTAGCAPNSGVTPATTHNSLSKYVNATEGMWAIASAEACLGPGNMYSQQKVNPTTWYPSRERGAAFVGWRPDDAGVAHIVTFKDDGSGFAYKGGGAAVKPEYEREFDPAGAAGLLKDKFEDRSSLHGVNLQTGDINFSPAADLSLGEGDFPYQLSFQRSFKAASAASPGLSEGWGHNLDIRAAISGDGLAKMGESSAYLAAETIAAIYTLQKIYSVAPAPASSPTATQQRDHLKRWVLAPFVGNWWGTRLTNNVVTITQGRSTQQYTIAPDSFSDTTRVYKAPRNGVGSVTQTGVRVVRDCECQEPPGQYFYDGWDYSGVSFAYNSPSKEVQAFSYYEFENSFQNVSGRSEKIAGRKTGWHLTSWTYPHGVSLSLSYLPLPQEAAHWNETDRLVSVSNNLGRTLTLNYTQTHDGTRLDSVSDGQGRSVQFGFELLVSGAPVTGFLTSVTNAENEVSRYAYLGYGFNMASVPAGSRPITEPRLWKVFAPSDTTYEKMRVDFDRTWRVKEFRDAVAVKTPAQRAPYQFLITGTNRGERLSPIHNLPDPHRWITYYDDRGRAFKIVDEESRIYAQLFDNRDRVKERTYPEGNKLLFEYDDVTQQIKKLTQTAKSSSYWSGSLPDLAVTATYDAACGKIKTVTDAKGKVTTFNYNSTTCTLTNVQQPQVANPQNGGVLATPTTSFLYNGLGQVTQITDPTMRVVAIEYDATSKYRLKRRVDPTGLNLTITYGHNTYGDVSSVDGARTDVSDVTQYSYDKQRRLKRADAPLASITRNCFDLDGDVIAVHRNKSTSTSPPDPNCAGAYSTTYWQSWSKSYTPTKQTYQEISPTSATTTTSYDGLDRVDVVQDPDGRKVKSEYFRDGKPKRIIKAYADATMAPITYATYTLTPNGQIDTVADANGNFTNLDYDGYDRLYRTFFSDPSSGLACTPSLPHSASNPSCGANQKYEQLGYDANGNITSKRNRSGNSIGFAFDDLNRETTRNVPVNSLGHFSRTLSTSYDIASRKWDLTADGQTLSHRYDAAGRLAYVDDSWIGVNNRTAYAYGDKVNRTQLTYPSGSFLTYAFDALNRLDTVTDNGGVTIANFDYDSLSRKDLLTLGNSGTAATVDWGYEADDDLNSLINNGPSPLTFTLGRNNSSQITSLAASDGAFLSRPSTTQADAYVPNKLNQIATLNGGALGYDANGNLTSDGTFVFEYDEENRLRKAVGGGKDIGYEYDPLGRRRLKQDNLTAANSIKFVSDGAEEIEERDTSNNVLRRYAYGAAIDERLVMYDSACSGGGRCFYRANWQGSTTHLINQDGSIRDTYHYGPYGERVDWTPTDPDTGNPYRYTGRRYDPETGLYFYRARYYSPKLGRFLQVDPIGTKDDMNLYGYTKADPLNLVDQGGGWSTPAHDAILDYSLKDALPSHVIDTLKSSSKAFDYNPINQLPGRAYTHAQIDGFSLREKAVPWLAEYKTSLFVEGSLNAAVAAALSGDYAKAYWNLGQGMHAIMDSTSPVHRKDGSPTPWPNGAQTFEHGEGGEGLGELTQELLDENRALLQAYYQQFLDEVTSKAIQKGLSCGTGASLVKCGGSLRSVDE